MNSQNEVEEVHLDAEFGLLPHVKNNLVEIQVKQNSESISEMDSSSELSFSVEIIGELEYQLKLEKDDRIISNLSLS